MPCQNILKIKEVQCYLMVDRITALTHVHIPILEPVNMSVYLEKGT